jgi:hypothetical protein
MNKLCFKDSNGKFRVVEAAHWFGLSIDDQRKIKLAIEEETNLRVKGAVMSVIK